MTLKTVSLGFLRRAGRRAVLPLIMIAVASTAAPAHAQTLSCQTVTQLEITSVSTSQRFLSFRLFNLHPGPLSVKITVGKVEAPWVAVNPLLDHFIYKYRSVSGTFAQTADLTAAFPTYLPVYDMPADPAALQVGVQDCVGH